MSGHHAPDLEVQHKTLWFPDGNIVLVSSTSKKHNHFRVHKSVLASQSSVFADMLSFPEPQDGLMETFDGHPVVRFSEGADNIEVLLEVFYNQRALPYGSWHVDTPLEVQETLLLADKFQADIVRERIVSHVHMNWPQDLGEWDAAEARLENLVERATYGGLEKPVDVLIPEPASVIALARKCDLPELLPAAFYSLSRIPIEHDYGANHTFPWELEELLLREVDISGMKHNGGSIDFKKQTARWRLLSLQDMRTYVLGRDRLERAVRDWRLFDAKPYKVCSLGRKCSIVIREVTDLVKNEALETRDILAVLWKYSRCSVLPTESKCCKSCRIQLQNTMKDTRREFWDSIPEYFELNAIPAFLQVY